MSGPQKPSKAQEKATQFFQRHAKRAWTAVFNGHLEAQIHDATLCLELRAAAWIERYSWGNNADSVCDSNGNIQTQSDFARMIKLLDKDGKPDRRAVSPVFIKFKRRGLITTKGQEIIPVDDPTFANYSLIVGSIATFGEDLAKVPTFRAFIEEIVANRHPNKFKVYQERAELWKEIRMELLRLYDDYVDQLSASLPTNSDARPKASRQNVGKPDDASDAANRHSAASSLLVQNQTHISGASSSFSSAREALAANEIYFDDDAFNQLIQRCEKADPDVTDEEVTHFIGLKTEAARSKKNPTGFLLAAIPNALQSPEMRKYRAQQKERKPAESEASAKAQKAGQR